MDKLRPGKPGHSQSPMAPKNPTAATYPQKNSLITLVILLTPILITIPFSFSLESFMHAKDIAAIFLLLLFTGMYLRKTSPRLTIPHFVTFLFLLIALPLPFAWLGRVAVPQFTTQQVIHQLTILFFTLMLWRTARHYKLNNLLPNSLVYASTTAASLALLQYVGFIDFLLPPIDGYPQRMYSVFGNQDLLGGFVAMGAALSLNNILQAKKTLWHEIIPLPILIVTLGLTGSRSAWLAFLIATILTIPYRSLDRNRLLITSGAGIAIVIGLILFSPESTIHRITTTFGDSDTGGNLRLWFWAGSALVLKDNFIFGVGPGNFSFHSPVYLGEALHQWPTHNWAAHTFHFNTIHTLHAHSDFLELIIERGIPGIITLILIAWYIKKHTSRYVWPGLISLIVFSMLNTTLHSTPYIFSTALLILTGTTLSSNNSETSNKILPKIAPFTIALILGISHIYFTILPGYQLQSAREAFANEQNSIPLYETLIQNTWSSPYASLELAALELERGDLVKAREMANKALNGIDTGEIYYIAGEIAYREGRAAQATSHFTKCTYRWPGYLPAWKRRIDLAVPTEAKTLFEQAKPFLTPEDLEWLKNYSDSVSTL